MHDFVPLQKSRVFLRKAPLGMVALLIANIIDYAAELRMAIGECAETLLPAKPTLQKRVQKVVTWRSPLRANWQFLTETAKLISP